MSSPPNGKLMKWIKSLTGTTKESNKGPVIPYAIPTRGFGSPDGVFGVSIFLTSNK